MTFALGSSVLMNNLYLACKYQYNDSMTILT